MEWINELKKGDKVILRKYSNYDYIWAVGIIARITKTLIICSLYNEEIRIRKAHGTEKADRWEHGWKLKEFTTENVNVVLRCRLNSKAKKIAHYFNNSVNYTELDNEVLIKAVEKMEEAKALISGAKDNG